MTVKRVTEAEKQRKATERSLTNLGSLIYDQIQNKEFPWIHMQSRSIDNIQYDPEVRQYIHAADAAKLSRACLCNVAGFPDTLLSWRCAAGQSPPHRSW